MAGDRQKGKVAIITGAGSRVPGGIGNGRATAILLAREGARVSLVDTVPDWAEETRQIIAAEGGDAFVIEADVTNPQACQSIVNQTVAHFGNLTTLVNNVGINGPRGTALNVDPDDWDTAMQVNVKSMMLMAKYAIPAMVETNQGGAIVNLGSVAGLMSGNPNLMYTASKGAVVQMTRAMAAHHAAQGIRVNCVCPGMVYTPMVYADGMQPQQRDARRQRSLLQTEGTGWDIGYAILFLTSDEARWITGVILPVDAGATAGKNMESPDTFYAPHRSATP
ncbi:MAG TPA: SDR family oxidoreductase [Chloroflexota bacterium]|jgi:NAD(P)-dependent dehydrogenase (short-subunit alcohol dehydrogenase family)|nr:SDR family oxidoreductase [Chloroflexota bacterium]